MSTALEALMAELLAEFRGELPQRCNDLEDAVLALENGQAGAFDELFRQVHSLKGTGGGVGMPIVTTICHQLESFIGEAKLRFDRKAASTALSYIDLLRRTATAEGQDSTGIAAIEQSLDHMRIAGLSGRASILVVDPSSALRILVQREFAGPSVQLHILKTGMEALQRMLHEPFDLLIISRELPDLNAIAVVAALREARCRNSAIPVVLVSSNPAPVPAHLEFLATVRRDVHLVPELTRHIGGVAARLRDA